MLNDDLFYKIEHAELNSDIICNEETLCDFFDSLSERTNQLLINVYHFSKRQEEENNYKTKYNLYLEDFIKGFILEFGRKKYLEVAKKLITSNTVKKFLTNAMVYNEPLTDIVIVSTVMNIPYFGLGKNSTIAIGSVMLLQTWNEEINTQKYLLSNFELYNLLEQVLKYCIKM